MSSAGLATVTVTSTVNPMWIDYCTKHSDIFLRNYCGYWLRGVEHDESIGWLAWEDDEKSRFDDEPNREAAVRAWRAGEALPREPQRVGGQRRLYHQR